MKSPDLDDKQIDVLTHLFKQAELIEELPKEERLRASNRLKQDMDSLIPPIQMLRMLSEYWGNR